MKDDGKAPIYYGMSNRAPFERMGYQTFYALVKRLARQAKISGAARAQAVSVWFTKPALRQGGVLGNKPKEEGALVRQCRCSSGRTRLVNRDW